jgi:hypothetical protein
VAAAGGFLQTGGMIQEQGIKPIDSLRLAEPLASQLRFPA